MFPGDPSVEGARRLWSQLAQRVNGRLQPELELLWQVIAPPG